MKTLKIGFITLSISFLSLALDYSDMALIFQASKLPSSSQLLGVWVGRCIHKTDPYQQWPAFFQFKRLKTSTQETFSQSHTWFNEQTNKYDTYTEEDLAKDENCKKWQELEQWNPVKYNNGSLTNFYQYPNSKAWRHTRLYRDGVREHIVVAYSLDGEKADWPASYCFFNIRLNEKP